MMAAQPPGSHALCSAPMMGVSDRHWRRFMRVLAPSARLYTAMVTEQAVRFGPRADLLRFHPAEHPLALQLGGASPAGLAQAARLGEAFGYDEINLNLGCPSARVGAGRFGAWLMRDVPLALACLKAMREAVHVPVSLKCRLGVDEQPLSVLRELAQGARALGIRHMIVHARKAWLAGVSPKENRSLPPLRYAPVYALKRALPDCVIVLNGGLARCAELRQARAQTDGVMLGRAAMRDPWLMRDWHAETDARPAPPSRIAAAEAFLPYMEAEMRRGTPLFAMSRHLLGLYHARPGARRWRQGLMAARTLADLRALFAAMQARDALAARARPFA